MIKFRSVKTSVWVNPTDGDVVTLMGRIGAISLPPGFAISHRDLDPEQKLEAGKHFAEGKLNCHIKPGVFGGRGIYVEGTIRRGRVVPRTGGRYRAASL